MVHFCVREVHLVVLPLFSCTLKDYVCLRGEREGGWCCSVVLAYTISPVIRQRTVIDMKNYFG